MSPTVKSFNRLPAIYTMSFCFHFFYFRNLTKHFKSILYVLHALEVLTSHYSERHTMGAMVRAIRSRNNHRPGWRTVLGESIVELWCSIRMSIMRTRRSTRGASSLCAQKPENIIFRSNLSSTQPCDVFVGFSFIFSRRNEDSGEDCSLEEHRG